MKKFLGLAVALLAIALVGCNGSPTSPVKEGACCTSGQCSQQTTEAECTQAGGVFKGIGVPCASDTCPAMAMISDVTINGLTVSFKLNGEGYYYFAELHCPVGGGFQVFGDPLENVLPGTYSIVVPPLMPSGRTPAQECGEPCATIHAQRITTHITYDVKVCWTIG